MSGAASKLSVIVSVKGPAHPRRTLDRVAGILVAALWLSVGCNVLYAGQTKPPHKHEVRHEIDQLEEAWRNAILKSDTAAMSALLADDYIAITSTGTLQTKEEALTNLRTRRMHITNLDVSDRKVRFYGNTAVVNSLAEVSGVNAEGDVTGSFRYTRVYVRDAQGHWKIVSFEASRIREPGERRQQDKESSAK
jgi:ketosteroid isomerase-like protein